MYYLAGLSQANQLSSLCCLHATVVRAHKAAKSKKKHCACVEVKGQGSKENIESGYRVKRCLLGGPGLVSYVDV